MIIHSAILDLTKLWRRAVRELVADLPEELDDERHYGRLADRIARKTNMHPGYIRSRLDQMRHFDHGRIDELERQGDGFEGCPAYRDLLKTFQDLKASP